jgi:hypothetical protein
MAGGNGKPTGTGVVQRRLLAERRIKFFDDVRRCFLYANTWRRPDTSADKLFTSSSSGCMEFRSSGLWHCHRVLSGGAWDVLRANVEAGHAVSTTVPSLTAEAPIWAWSPGGD